MEIALQNIKDKKMLKISDDIKNLLENNVLFLRAIDSKNGKKFSLRIYENIKLQD